MKRKGKKRGQYRAVYSALIDDPDFQTLSPNARLTLLVARLCPAAGPSAFFRYYPDLLARQTGLSVAAVEAAITELVAADWIEHDGVLLWIKNGLKYDPAISLSNQNHRDSIQEYLLQLPKREIITRFCEHYDLPMPWATHGDTIPHQGVVKSDEERSDKGRVISDCGSASEAARRVAVATFEAYSQAYQQRYGAPATVNAKVRGQIAQFVARVPQHEAPEIAAHYVRSNYRRYVEAGHAVGLMLLDAEKLRTEYLTGRRMSATEARQADEHEQRRSVGLRLLRKAEAQAASEPRDPEGPHGYLGANGHHTERNGYGGDGRHVESIRSAARAGCTFALSDRTPPPDALG